MASGSGTGERNRAAVVLRVVLLVSLLVMTVGVAYLAAAPVPRANAFTEFYVTGADGNPVSEGANVTAGEPREVTVGIVNQERRQQTYTVQLSGEAVRDRSWSTTVDDGATVRRNVSLTFDEAGTHRVNIDLYRGESAAAEPYRELRLVVDVVEGR